MLAIAKTSKSIPLDRVYIYIVIMWSLWATKFEFLNFPFFRVVLHQSSLLNFSQLHAIMLSYLPYMARTVNEVKLIYLWGTVSKADAVIATIFLIYP